MLLIVGTITVLVCVFGGFVMMGGHLEVLIQPFELVIIGGAAAGAFIISNTKSVIRASFKGAMSLLKAPKYKNPAISS